MGFLADTGELLKKIGQVSKDYIIGGVEQRLGDQLSKTGSELTKEGIERVTQTNKQAVSLYSQLGLRSNSIGGSFIVVGASIVALLLFMKAVK